MTIVLELQRIQDLLSEIAMNAETTEDAMLAVRANRAVRDIARGVAPAPKTGKKRGRKPGSKNAPKVTAEGGADASAPAPEAKPADHRHEFPTGAVGEPCSVDGCTAKKANRGRKPKSLAGVEGVADAIPVDDEPAEQQDTAPSVPLPHRTPGWQPTASDDDLDELDQ
jgi:hypothetical protein